MSHTTVLWSMYPCHALCNSNVVQVTTGHHSAKESLHLIPRFDLHLDPRLHLDLDLDLCRRLDTLILASTCLQRFRFRLVPLLKTQSSA